MERKIDTLRRFMDAGEWEKAVRFAARFPRLGEHKAAITRAASALLSPALYRDMGKDPEVLLEEAVSALKMRYPSFSDSGKN